MASTVLILGSGAREHALAWKLSRSPKLREVLVAPGNGGTTGNIPLDITNFEAIAAFCHERHVSLVVVGPEDPLANGVVDVLERCGVRTFGPCKEAARLEASKAFSKDFMAKYGIPTARYEVFREYEAAKRHIESAKYKAYVVKASGLAAGKGVVVASSVAEACEAARRMLQDKLFGAACDEIVIEELLEGTEVSVLCFTDGDTVKLMPPAQDHKRLLDDDQGPNTGGMGAYAPCNLLISKETLEEIRTGVLEKTVHSLRASGVRYKGVLYAGLMLTNEGPRVLEFNCRFGDPETEVIIPLLESDLYDVLLACVNGTLDACDVRWSTQSAVGVVVASAGYPNVPRKGLKITGLDALSSQPADGVIREVFHAATKRVNGDYVTTGGRVLCCVAIAPDLRVAARAATTLASVVHFEGAQFRHDIAHASLKRMTALNGVENGVSTHADVSLTYAHTGVSVDRGDELVRRIEALTRSTARAGATAEIGGFGGEFDLHKAGYKSAPVLVAGTDGVGTKLKIAQELGIHTSIGVDLVAMCVNDVLSEGAEPLFFLDYFATGHLQPGVAAEVVDGICRGCREANCALIGGETAEMPGFYATGEYDLAGFAVGAVERSKKLPKMAEIKKGDKLLALASSGVHSNGFSLVRKIVELSGLTYSSACPWEPTISIGTALLTPTRIYVKPLLAVLQSGRVKAAAHITGGGLLENLPRVFPASLCARLDGRAWKVPEVFKWLASVGNVSAHEMVRTFNCGLGMVLVVGADECEEVRRWILGEGETNVVEIGTLFERSSNEPAVVLDEQLLCHTFSPRRAPTLPKVRVAILISGTGSNMQALIDYAKNPLHRSVCEICLVISNKADVLGLQRASAAGVKTKVISHVKKTREVFDKEVDDELRAANVQLVCLAGFMRILTPGFVNAWLGRMINIHPSLLPAFPGGDAVGDALAAGVKVTGATVHIVVPEVDAGKILAQDAVRVEMDDTKELLQQRIHRVEHKIFPGAMEALARELQGRSD